MRKPSYLLSLALAAAACAASALASSVQPSAGTPTGLHDFDFQVGNWHVRHRVKRADGSWVEFEGFCSNRPVMDGWGNVEDQRFDKPSGVTHGVALRTFDAKTRQWAIWWVDGRDPFGALDPPVKGRFENGVGTFYSDGVAGGVPVRTRFVWSQITRASAHWEQASSLDAGATWDTNWTMEFRRE